MRTPSFFRAPLTECGCNVRCSPLRPCAAAERCCPCSPSCAYSASMVSEIFMYPQHEDQQEGLCASPLIPRHRTYPLLHFLELTCLKPSSRPCLSSTRRNERSLACVRACVRTWLQAGLPSILCCVLPHRKRGHGPVRDRFYDKLSFFSCKLGALSLPRIIQHIHGAHHANLSGVAFGVPMQVRAFGVPM